MGLFRRKPKFIELDRSINEYEAFPTDLNQLLKTIATSDEYHVKSDFLEQLDHDFLSSVIYERNIKYNLGLDYRTMLFATMLVDKPGPLMMFVVEVLEVLGEKPCFYDVITQVYPNGWHTEDSMKRMYYHIKDNMKHYKYGYVYIQP